MSGKVSYTQLSMFNNCQWQWKLNYIDDLRTFNGNIYTLFGTAMHEVLQLYLQVMYSESVKKANELPFDKLLMECMVKEFKSTKGDSKEYPCSKEELEQIGELLSKALEDGKISSKEWLAIGGKNGLGILGGK